MAVTDLLKHLPADTGMSYIYIQHLDPSHESRLDEVLGRVTKMPVMEATEKLKIKPNHVYIIPPNRQMTLADGSLRLSLRPTRPQTHLPINYFFNSLAENYGERAIGVLLSGNPPDGTLGLKAIKSAGGITFAQDATAQFAGMPKNAVAQEAVDLVMPPARIADELAKLSQQQKKYQLGLNTSAGEALVHSDEHILNILGQVYRLTGVDFSHYKINTIRRRIVRRMLLKNMDNVDEYIRYLQQNPGEVNQLYQDLLINVTQFFRDIDCVEYLKKTLLPKLVKLKSEDDPIRVWVPACSTGQEAYSLAILLIETLGEKWVGTAVQIFASDLSEMAINKARLGIYTSDEVADVSPARLQRFFVKAEGSYRVVKSIRDLCIFAAHNVLKEPPFSRLDIISCCNLLIYLEANLQKKLMATFHYSLNSNGFLVLGKSETIGAATNLFSQVEKKCKVYAKKKDVAARALFELSYRGADAEKDHTLQRKGMGSKTKPDEGDLDKLVDQALLKRYTPACVVVNHELDIVQFRGSTGLFLEPSPGKASLNLLKMARPGLGLELRNLVHKALKSGLPEEKVWLETLSDSRSRKMTIEAIPLKNTLDSLGHYCLVIFGEEYQQEKAALPAATKRDRRVRELEDELMALREDMRSIVEEQEAANEELQSVNEEIVSSNEELQSINEELETSREELESSNEELITINQELQMRNEQLAEVQEYSEAVFATIRESLLILDKNLRIKTANACFYQTFGLIDNQTEGQFIYDLADKQWNMPRLRELLEEIIPRNSQINDFEVVHTFPYIGEKIMMLNARRLISRVRNEHLILLAIEDVTRHRQATRMIAEKEEWFRNTADHSPMMLWVADAGKKLQFVNKTWLDYRDKALDEALGQSWIEDMHPDDIKPITRLFDESFRRQKPFTAQYRLKHGDDYKLILSKGNPNFSHEGQFIGYIGSCVELPEKVGAGN